MAKNGMVPVVGGGMMQANDAISSGFAKLQGELERLDPIVKEPLYTTFYARDIPLEYGGGWIEFESNLFSDYGAPGADPEYSGGVYNNIPIVNADVQKDAWRVLPFKAFMQIPLDTLNRMELLSYNLEDGLRRSVTLKYEKWVDSLAYSGMDKMGFYGLLNNPDVTVEAAPNGAAGTATWATKTPEEIVADINNAILSVWMQAGYVDAAMPNHILIDPQNFARITTESLTMNNYPSGTTILDYIKLHNIYTQTTGKELFVFSNPYCRGTNPQDPTWPGAGVGGTNRMVVYNMDSQYLAMRIAVALGRSGRMPSLWNVQNVSFDTLYEANVGQVKIYYNQTVLYVDGI